MLRIFMAVLMIPTLFMVINYLSSDTQFVYANSNRLFVYISNGGDGNIACDEVKP